MSKTLSPNSPIFFDLDGVLLDVSERYFRVYCDIMKTFGRQTVDKTTYWDLKRDQQPLSLLLAIGGNRHISEEAYRAQWLHNIELPEYLEYDTVIPGALEQLKRLQQYRRLILVTMRQRRDYLEEQLDRLCLSSFFVALLSAALTRAEGWETRRHLISESGLLSEDALIVGDTEIDIRTGKSLGLTTVAVLSGIRNRKRLAHEHPDLIVEDINALSSILSDN